MTDTAYQLYWGDLHRQSNVSDGEGDLAEHFRVARDEAGLDFYAMTDHAVLTADPCDRAYMGPLKGPASITDARTPDELGDVVALHRVSDAAWRTLQGLVHRFYAPGSFVTLLGYEWSCARYGDRSVYYLADEQPIRVPRTLPELYRMLEGVDAMLTPHHTGVRVRGEPVGGQPPCQIERRGIAYVPEGRGFFPGLSVRENLVMGERAGRDGRRDWSLERVLATFPRLAERMNHLGAQLSGGEQQMLAIGRALMTNPDLMILDEATEGLAPLVVAEIWRIIALIRSSGIASLIVDRNYRAVLEHADRGVVLEKGRVVLEGPSNALLADEERLRRHLSV